jgi:hypothetical protein
MMVQKCIHFILFDGYIVKCTCTNNASESGKYVVLLMSGKHINTGIFTWNYDRNEAGIIEYSLIVNRAVERRRCYILDLGVGVFRRRTFRINKN